MLRRDGGNGKTSTVREAMELYERKGNVVSATKTRALLHDLEG